MPYKVAFSQDRSVGGFLELLDGRYTVQKIDLAFPVLHGKNGEDGTVQGLLELAGVPIVGCGTLASALCMDKDRAHKLVSLEGISVPKSVAFKKSEINDAVQKIKDSLSFPIFVKPVRAGSSFGVTKVSEPEKLENTATLIDNQENSLLSTPCVAERSDSISNEILSRMGARLPIVIKE